MVGFELDYLHVLASRRIDEGVLSDIGAVVKKRTVNTIALLHHGHVFWLLLSLAVFISNVTLHASL